MTHVDKLIKAKEPDDVIALLRAVSIEEPNLWKATASPLATLLGVPIPRDVNTMLSLCTSEKFYPKVLICACMDPASRPSFCPESFPTLIDACSAFVDSYTVCAEVMRLLFEEALRKLKSKP